MIELCPSILSADFNHLGDQMQMMEQEGIRWVHIDVMDGSFVPSISFGMPVIKSIRQASDLFFDVHLMIQEPARYIQDFAASGADSLTVHVEACTDPLETLRGIHAAGMRTGISVKPNTPVEDIFPLLEEADLVLIMTVEPGFGGQKYIPACTQKVRRIREEITRRGLKSHVQVDGGIYDDTLPIVLEAGADRIVAGSWAFKGDLAANIRHIRKAIQEQDTVREG